MEGGDPQTLPQDMIAVFRAQYAGRAALVFALSLGTGQRIGDVPRMKWEDTGGDGIKVKQGKTAQLLLVPFTRHLRAALKAARRRSVFVLLNHHAMEPWSYRGASQAIGPIIGPSPEMVRHDTRAMH